MTMTPSPVLFKVSSAISKRAESRHHAMQQWCGYVRMDFDTMQQCRDATTLVGEKVGVCGSTLEPMGTNRVRPKSKAGIKICLTVDC